MAKLTELKTIPAACLLCIHEKCMEEGTMNEVVSACYMCKNNPRDNRPSEFVEKKIYCC